MINLLLGRFSQVFPVISELGTGQSEGARVTRFSRMGLKACGKCLRQADKVWGKIGKLRREFEKQLESHTSKAKIVLELTANII